MQPATGGLDPTPPDPGATALLFAPHAFLLLAAVLAFLLARRDRRHRPVFVALAVTSGSGILHAALRYLVLVPAREVLGAVPYSGSTRVVFHLTQACVLASLVALPWLCREVLCELPPGPNRRRHLLAGATWAGLLAILVIGYPELRGDALRRVYLAAELAALFACAVVIVTWTRRRGWVSKIPASVQNAIDACADTMGSHARVAFEAISVGAAPRWWTTATVLALVAGDAVLLLVGAWRYGLFGAAYGVQQAGLLALYVVVAGMHAVALALTRRGP